MELRYRLPPVELRAGDLQWLWDEIKRLCEDPPEGTVLLDLRSKVEATRGEWPSDESIEDSDMEQFLNSGVLPDVLDSLTIEFRPEYQYQLPGDMSLRYKEGRGVNLSFKEAEWIDKAGTRVSLGGEPEWVSQVRGSLDPFLSKRARRARSRRVATLALWIASPIVVLWSWAYRLRSGDVVPVALLLSSLIWFLLGAILLPGKAKRLYPDFLLVIDERGLERPWYFEWAKELCAALLVTVASSVILAVLWPWPV